MTHVVEIFGHREIDATKYSNEDLRAFGQCYDNCVDEIVNSVMMGHFNYDGFRFSLNKSHNAFGVIIETDDIDLAKEFANSFDAPADNYGINYELKLDGIVMPKGRLIR